MSNTNNRFKLESDYIAAFNQIIINISGTTGLCEINDCFEILTKLNQITELFDSELKKLDG